MALVTLSHLGMAFDGPALFDDVTLEIDPGRKIGVIGQNGTGKSTLLKLVAGELEPTAGEIFRQRGTRVAYQAQELVTRPGATVLDEMRSLFAAELAREARLHEIEQRLATETGGADQERLLADYARLQEEHDLAGGYGVEQRIETVLTGLGLPREAWTQPVEAFSGGERNIIGLARILLSDPDVLLLDEPSNHLDMDGLEWFIRFVRSSAATVVMVSHDRHLLDATVQEIWQVGRGRVRRWTGNYSDYQQQRAEERALQERQYRNQQRTIKRLEFQARRLRDMARAYDDPGQAKRAKSLLKRIEQMDTVERPDGDEQSFNASLTGGSRHGHIALALRGFEFSYGERVIFEPFDLEIDYGQRVCLVGPNGSGKSTLFKSILAEGSWENPRVRLGKAVKVGDYNQFHQDVMDERQSLIDWMQDQTHLDYQPATELLHRFLFTRDDLERPIGTLSGGEKSRLQLARLVHEKVNLLMLDEPTNHLDIQACEQLERMLDEFDGTLLIISHDRYFLDKLVDVVLEIRDRRVVPFRGSFAAWYAERSRKAEGRARGALTLHSQKEAAGRDKSEAQREREERKAKQREDRKLRNRVAALEKQIAGHEERIDELNRQLEAAYSEGGDATRGPEIARELEQIKSTLEDLYPQWEDAASRAPE